jgi:hypothetical protein
MPKQWPIRREKDTIESEKEDGGRGKGEGGN